MRLPFRHSGAAAGRWAVSETGARTGGRALRRRARPGSPLHALLLALLPDLLDPRHEPLPHDQELRPLHRRTFARHVAGLSYEEIAAETGQTWRQVSRHLTRSREALQEPVVVA